jgi:tRNA dimethylallyltransferase
VLRFLDGEITETQARDLTIFATRKFARRQEAWFRKDPRITWLAHDRSDLTDAVTALALDSIRRVPH